MTGYHQPRGIHIWFQSRLIPVGAPEKVELTDVRRLVLEPLELYA